MSVTAGAGVAGQAAELRALVLEMSGAADAHALAMWKDGYRVGAAGQFEAGYAAAVADVKAAEHGLADHLRGLPAESVRWAVRGEPRIRVTFGRPHGDDYPGQGGAAS
jgi:hypothetical protein